METIPRYGVANRKSVATIAKTLESEGAEVIYSVRSENGLRVWRPCSVIEKPTPDVEFSEQIQSLAESVAEDFGSLDGIVHSIACQLQQGFSSLPRDGERTLQATAISAFSWSK